MNDKKEIVLTEMEYLRIVAAIGYINGLTESNTAMLNSLQNFATLDEFRAVVNSQAVEIMTILKLIP